MIAQLNEGFRSLETSSQVLWGDGHSQTQEQDGRVRIGELFKKNSIEERISN